MLRWNQGGHQVNMTRKPRYFSEIDLKKVACQLLDGMVGMQFDVEALLGLQY